MKRVYVSSTIADLEEFRRAVCDTLRNSGYDVDSMERYPARDDRPKSASEADVGRCDYYVGIVAWRYGYVPEQDNSDARSITELEYLAAGAAGKPRFVFLLDDKTPWSSVLRDADLQDDGGRRIREFRNNLRKSTWINYFHSPDSLAKNVLVTLLQYEATKRAETLKPLDDIKSAVDLGPSYLENVGKNIGELGSIEFVSLHLGPTPWWNTRFHLVAALASDFTDIQQFIVFNARGGFELIAPPTEIRRALAKATPKLEAAYQTAREFFGPSVNPIDAVTLNYSVASIQVFNQPESAFKQVVTPLMLRELGFRQQGEAIDLEWHGGSLTPFDIVLRKARFLVLMRDSKCEGIVDRVEIASRLAQVMLG
jgi:Domain of unknown function (DUF4062)